MVMVMSLVIFILLLFLALFVVVVAYENCYYCFVAVGRAVVRHTVAANAVVDVKPVIAYEI